ncbi:MAG: DUF6455 family protein [Methyloceanibacter sp.]|nr:DUF6455 family protein [Methyloceanibacter sp.]
MTNSALDLASFHRPVLMEDMIETTGVNPLDVIDLDGGKSYLRARANCHNCTCKAVCSNWLSVNKEGDPQPFCPNADLLRMIKS